jgi:ammonium transporter, Amt family
MIPGLGFFYAGLTRTKNALTLLLICILSAAIVSVEWLFWGFSLSFSESSGNVFIGNFGFAGFSGVGGGAVSLAAPSVPGITFALYQLQFASITPAISKHVL